MGFSEIPVCQSDLADLHLVTTVFHLLTCLELYEGVKKFHPHSSERAGLGGVPGAGSLRVVPSLSRCWTASTAIERNGVRKASLGVPEPELRSC